jgi:uncharacterized protein YceH (UPF0502 family)
MLCVLMLRGPQTPGELKQRTERLHRFDDLASVVETLDALAGRDLVERLDRRPGQKEERYRHLLGSDREGQATASAEAPAAQPPATAPAESLERRVDALEAEVEHLREVVRALEARLDRRPDD